MSRSAIHSDGAAWISGAPVEKLGPTVEKGAAAESLATLLPFYVTRSAPMTDPAVEMGGRTDSMAVAFEQSAARRVRNLDRVIKNSGASVEISDGSVENSDTLIEISRRTAKMLAAFEFSTRAANFFFIRPAFHAAVTGEEGKGDVQDLQGYRLQRRLAVADRRREKCVLALARLARQEQGRTG